ncbi:acyl carrier protein [Streptomyces sp. NPDC048483]|uniref:acyl carrier protein n=1 Tax=Streptomyces sp. NPDC048483 TaxID=3154927 RepID=UPI00343318D8
MTSAPAVLEKEELRATVAAALDAEVSDVTDTASFVDDLEVDSLMALEVVVVLEKKYSVKLQETDLKRIGCLQDAYTLLSERLRAA